MEQAEVNDLNTAKSFKNTATDMWRRRHLASVRQMNSCDDDLKPQLLSLLSFAGAPKLFRGTRLGQVLHHGGSILSGSGGSAATYELSQSLDEQLCLDAFLSHNWAVGRVKKFITLAFEFNFDLALGIMILASIPVGVASYLRLLPVDSSVVQDPIPSTILGRVVLGPVFMFCLLFVRDLYGFRSSGPLVFLDKTCIHQESAEIKQAGIQKLGAFLCRSKRMVVIYTDIYLTKLWTVFELACFLSLHPADSLIIAPVARALVFFGMTMVSWSFMLFVSVVALEGGFYQVMYIIGIVFLALFTVVQRRWTREKIALLDSLRNFEVKNCVCAVETDRPVVYRHIVTLMRAALDLPADSNFEEVLDAFNMLVRTELSGVLAQSFGRFSIEYKHCVALSFIASGTWMVDSLEGCTDGTPISALVAYNFKQLTWVLTVWPIFLRVMELASWRQLHNRGWRAVPWLAFVMFAVLGCAAGTSHVMNMAVWASQSSNTVFIPFLVGTTMVNVVAVGLGLGLFSQQGAPVKGGGADRTSAIDIGRSSLAARCSAMALVLSGDDLEEGDITSAIFAEAKGDGDVISADTYGLASDDMAVSGCDSASSFN